MILIDTSVLYAFVEKQDSCHLVARQKYLTIPSDQILIPSDIIKEFLTLIIRRNEKVVKAVYRELENDPRKPFIYNLETVEFFEFMDFFQKFASTKLSIPDLQLLFLAQKYKFSILTFDKELKTQAKILGINLY